ncbi:MAG: hypothetical protein HYX78_00915 [Armatimonadetes bacterium]|nr:hypothetical protein [Armatimonadota bacterium]
MEVEIRHMTIEDYDEIVALWQGVEGIGLDECDSRENFEKYLERNPAAPKPRFPFIDRARNRKMRFEIAAIFKKFSLRWRAHSGIIRCQPPQKER